MKSPRAQNLSSALILIVFQIIATGVATPVLIKGNIGDNATLPCVFPELKGLPLNDIRVNWQTKEHKVLLFMNSGTVEYHHAADQFRGRTDFFQENLLSGNFSLLLAGLVARDEEDDICCYIQVNGNTGFSIWNSSGVRLEVSGSFSQPLLEGPGKNSFTCKDSINFTCTSKSEYPEPQVEWTVNQKKYHAHPSVTLDHDFDTKLFNVSSTLTITASEVQSVRCSVINTRNKKARHSVSLSFPNCNYSSPSVEEPAFWKTALGVLVVVVLLAVTGIFIFFRKYRWPSSSDPANVTTVSPIVPANGSTSYIENELLLLPRNHTETSNNTD